MWKGVGFGDTRLSINNTVMRKWQEKVLRNPCFLQKGSLCQYHPAESNLSMTYLNISGIGSEQLFSLIYWLCAASIVVGALIVFARCFWAWSRRNSAQEYAALVDEEEDDFRVEEKRTGYGTLL
jgi:hypothetical protein